MIRTGAAGRARAQDVAFRHREGPGTAAKMATHSFAMRRAIASVTRRDRITELSPCFAFRGLPAHLSQGPRIQLGVLVAEYASDNLVEFSFVPAHDPNCYS